MAPKGKLHEFVDKGWKESENPEMLRTSFVDGRLQSEARFMHREECQPPCVELFLHHRIRREREETQVAVFAAVTAVAVGVDEHADERG